VEVYENEQNKIWKLKTVRIAYFFCKNFQFPKFIVLKNFRAETRFCVRQAYDRYGCHFIPRDEMDPFHPAPDPISSRHLSFHPALKMYSFGILYTNSIDKSSVIF
jgi:hypothetical protein